MFGQDDTQQTNQVPDDALSASLPDPLANGTLATPSDNAPFDLPAPAPADPTATSPAPAPVAVASDSLPTTDDLLNMKQEALQHLSPLVGHLDQSPEEKFRTTMMMIQAADDQSLLKAAYEAAKLITDEKARAQALLDVVNEINYFTQQHHHAS